MTDWIIVVILAVIVLLAIKPVVQHFRGQGGCCGGGSYKARPKKLHTVVEKRTFHVEGMHCQNCVNRVMEALNDLDGVSARVQLHGGKAVVSLEKSVEDAVLLNALEKAGYPAKRL